MSEWVSDAFAYRSARKTRIAWHNTTCQAPRIFTWELFSISLDIDYCTEKKRLEDCYTRLLRAAVSRSLRDHISNKALYDWICLQFQIRRLQLSGHCWRSKNKTVSQLLLWYLKHCRRSRGRPATTFIDQLESQRSFEAGSCICHGQQTGMGQTKISAGAPEIDR